MKGQNKRKSEGEKGQKKGIDIKCTKGEMRSGLGSGCIGHMNHSVGIDRVDGHR